MAADALDWLRQMLGGGQDAQPAAGGGQALQQLQDRLGAGDQVQTAPQTWRPPDLSALLGMPSALEQSAAASAANPYQPGMTAGQVMAGRPDDPVAGSFQPGVGVGAIRAYHGSPHLFEAEPGAPLGRFRWDKIGTGEGAQAYGYAPAYVAENEGVARGYRDALTVPSTTDPAAHAWDLINTHGWTKAQVIDELGRNVKTRPESDPLRKFYQDTIDTVKTGAVDKYKPPSGHMYEVDINAKPEDFLPWDRPASQWADAPLNAVQDIAAAQGMKLGDVTGERFYKSLADRLWGDRPGPSRLSWPGAGDKAAVEASQLLGEAGIPGSRYLDQGSRAAGQGSYNYAVWTPELVTIMRRFGLLPPLAAGAGLVGGSQEADAQQKIGNSTMWTRGNSSPWDYNAALGYPGLRGRANIDTPLAGGYKAALMKQQARGLLDSISEEPLK